jgi:hypothetical protein
MFMLRSAFQVPAGGRRHCAGLPSNRGAQHRFTLSSLRPPPRLWPALIAVPSGLSDCRPRLA